MFFPVALFRSRFLFALTSIPDDQGVFCARGERILIVDADGATRFSDLDRLEERMNQIERDGHGVVVGSRAHMQGDAVAKVRERMYQSKYFLAVVLFVVGG
jgi:dolichyl-phosphate beta-glucosyltransferase